MPSSRRRRVTPRVAGRVTGPSRRILAGLIALGVFVTLGLRLGLTMESLGPGAWDALWNL